MNFLPAFVPLYFCFFTLPPIFVGSVISSPLFLLYALLLASPGAVVVMSNLKSFTVPVLFVVPLRDSQSEFTSQDITYVMTAISIIFGFITVINENSWFFFPSSAHRFADSGDDDNLEFDHSDQVELDSMTLTLGGKQIILDDSESDSAALNLQLHDGMEESISSDEFHSSGDSI